ncbi:HAD family hydrolase [bacterium]|nr:HAD family hydrolase [bacterium]
MVAVIRYRPIGPSQSILFLDRDGIINIDKGYTNKIDDFNFMPGIIQVCDAFQKNNFGIVVVTNQSGIGRGYYTEANFIELSNWMVTELETQGIQISAVYYCPHTPEANCNCRKPKAAMIADALATYGVSAHHSWMIGDKESDIDAATNAGIRNSIRIAPLGESTRATHHFESLNELAILQLPPIS